MIIILSFHEKNLFLILLYSLSYLGRFQLNSKENVGYLWLVGKMITAWIFTLYVRKYGCIVVLL